MMLKGKTILKSTTYLLIFLILLTSCNTQQTETENSVENKMELIEGVEEVLIEVKLVNPLLEVTLADTVNFANVALLTNDAIFDIKYASKENFTGKIIYDCPACFMQTNAASTLAKASELANEKGFKLKIFDCYRPQEYQYRLWEAFPNINYVAPPEKKSMHSYGCAVDLTLVDSLGSELDMGTEFDSFLKNSYTFSAEISDTAKANRAILIEIMDASGFRPIKTEWWHFYFIACDKSVNNALKWECE